MQPAATQPITPEFADTFTSRLARSSRSFFWHPRWLAFAIILVAWQILAVVRDTRVIPLIC